MTTHRGGPRTTTEGKRRSVQATIGDYYHRKTKELTEDNEFTSKYTPCRLKSEPSPRNAKDSASNAKDRDIITSPNYDAQVCPLPVPDSEPEPVPMPSPMMNPDPQGGTRSKHTVVAQDMTNSIHSTSPSLDSILVPSS